MNKKYKIGLFIFRRDLRLEDNTGLIMALKTCEKVIPVFNFDPIQIDKEKNQYFSEPAFYFMLNSLEELDKELKKLSSKLYIFYNEPTKTLESLINHDKVEAVFLNKDYTPFARKRDGALFKSAEKNKVDFNICNDYTLSPIETIKTEQNKTYSVFTPFMKKACQYEVATPTPNTFTNYYQGKLKTPTTKLSDFKAEISNMTPILKGGRNEALEIIKKPTYLKDYHRQRDLPANTKGTSHLSAHHKFGTISIRESYKVANDSYGAWSQYLAELYWRDFYYYIAYHFPHVFGEPFLPWAKNINWLNDKGQYEAWCQGKTGVPMVDAGMRELNQTGYMHNRSRMITASFLTKNLLIDWRWGEQYFAKKLIDYDPSQNNGGWQWGASTGADPKPIRIFNPYTQASKYDSNAEYIKRWIPELVDVPNNVLSDGKTQNFTMLAPLYPPPLIDQKMSYHRAREAYKEAKEKYKDLSKTA